jgi:hypothetical protein
MLMLAEELRDRHEFSFVCLPGPGGTAFLERAAGLGLEVGPLEVRGEPRADAELGAFLQRCRVDLFHSHAGSSLEGHAGVRAAAACGVADIVRTEHLAELSVLLPIEELPDLVYSPYHLPDRRPRLAELTEMVARERSAYLERVRPVDRIICVSEGGPGHLP